MKRKSNLSLGALKYADPVIFARDILDLEVEPFHKEWLDAFQNNRFLVLLAPRGHGKTTIVGSYILWRIVKDRNIRILICTINQDKANSMMTFVKENLAGNQKLIDTFGEFKGSLWSSDQIRVKQLGHSLPQNEPTLKVLGVGSRIISAHYDLIVLDDITDEDNSKTEHRRRELEDWYNGPLVGTFMRGIQVINIGTRWHEDDIHNYLMNKAGYHTIRYQALLNPDEIDAGGQAKVLWPAMKPWNREMITKVNIEREVEGLVPIPEDTITLEFIRDHQGEVFFQTQYQNNIVARGINKFKPEWIEQALDKYRKLDVVPLGLKKYIGVDLGGEEKTSDYGVTTCIGLDNDANIYVLDCVKGHNTINRQMDIMASIYEKNGAIKVGMDAAAQQKSITSEAIRDNPTIPIIPIKSSRIDDKDTRIERLAVLFETGRVILNSNLTPLIDELKLYPRSKHDDCLDSLCFAIEVATPDKDPLNWDKVPELIKVNRGPSYFRVTGG